MQDSHKVICHSVNCAVRNVGASRVSEEGKQETGAGTLACCGPLQGTPGRGGRNAYF